LGPRKITPLNWIQHKVKFNAHCHIDDKAKEWKMDSLKEVLPVPEGREETY